MRSEKEKSGRELAEKFLEMLRKWEREHYDACRVNGWEHDGTRWTYVGRPRGGKVQELR